MPDGYQIINQDSTYFLTFQVVGWADIFSRKIYRDIIVDSLDYCRKNKGLEIFAYVIMTNHVHIVLRSKTRKLSDTIRDFKRHTSKTIMTTLDEFPESRKEWLNMIFKYYAKYNKRANEKQVWTHENHAVELTDNNMIDSRIECIHQNPVKAAWVENQFEYLYSSARNFANLDSVLEIDEI
jgi:REP element-mobilizing transposase RayT